MRPRIRFSFTKNFPDGKNRGSAGSGDRPDFRFRFFRKQPDYDGNAVFDDARFFPGNFREGVSQKFRVIRADGRNDAYFGNDDVGGVQTPAQARFDNGGGAAFPREPQERHRRHQFKERREILVSGFAEGICRSVEFFRFIANSLV